MLLVFIAEMIVERGDELIDLYCKAILNAERHARQKVKDQREKTARARDERSHLAGTLARMLLDAAAGGEDPLARAHCARSASSASAPLSRIPARWQGRSRSSAATRWATATPISRSSPPQSSRPWICAARGYQPLLDAINHVNANRSLRVLGDANADVTQQSVLVGVVEFG